jgi:spoIIIJ-associated protein
VAKYTVDETGPKIEAFLEPVLDAADLDVEYTIEPGEGMFADFETPDLMVKFSGPDTEILLENKAELLLALEQLTSEVLRMNSDEHSMICFDANDHRALRLEELRVSALTAAERVKKTKQPFHFSPMNSRERRIIHLSLRNETDVRSESVGVPPYRQVVIVTADTKELPPPIIPPPPRPERDNERRGGDRGRGPRRDGDRRGGPPRGGPGGGRGGPGGGRDRGPRGPRH